MAFLAIIPWSASRASPLAVPVVESRRHKHPAVASAVHFSFRRATVSYQLLSTSRFCSRSVSSTSRPRSPDERLLEVLQSEIDDLEQSEDFDKVPTFSLSLKFLWVDVEGNHVVVFLWLASLITHNVEVPEGFPFKVEDNVGKQTDKCTINSLSLKNPETDDQLAYEGPDFLDLDGNLRKAFHGYLFARGIRPSTVGFLQDYMIEKDNKEYHRWLKNVKKFVES
ncbi:hypothetical protein Cgig2_005731 [Carnegiea gigantea]|uniref:Uncharacterized protein n=1 Tax=Carnegiea gigantea TaxID=171969 RepID=A0A9Q1KGM4_9CARY|nr:hypothetical protein Cgig2_005731 [Carnegiea gigantea]